MFRALTIAALSLLPVGDLFAATSIGTPISATFAAQNSPYGGVCPGILKFAGTISGPANQSVTYVFNRTIKGVVLSSVPVRAALDGTGHSNVSDSFSVDATGAGADELQVLPSGVKMKADFTVNCNPIAVTPSPHVARLHIFTAEGSYPVVYPYPFDLSKCSAPPPLWLPNFRANLKAGYTTEKAYYQEKDKYASPAVVGFIPEVYDQACIHWVVTLGHYSDQPMPASAFFITGRHINGGPMYCITMISGAHTPSGEAAVSMAGGPISSPEACAALPPAYDNTQSRRVRR